MDQLLGVRLLDVSTLVGTLGTGHVYPLFRQGTQIERGVRNLPVLHYSLTVASELDSCVLVFSWWIYSHYLQAHEGGFSPPLVLFKSWGRALPFAAFIPQLTPDGNAKEI